MLAPLVQLKITSATCSFVAICTTSWRLYLRRERYWWDDACAFLSLIFLFLQISSVFMHVPNPQIFSRTTNVAAYYIMAATFYAIIWTARLSILFSVIRIDPNPNSRRLLKRIAGIFILILLIMIAQLFWVCEPIGPTWKNKTSPQCPLDTQVAVCQLVTDVISDSLIIYAPLRLIRNMDSTDGSRRRLMIIFSTSIITTIVSLVHASLIFLNAGIKVVIAAMVEDTFSLIVCNLPVVATALLRVWGRHEEDSDQGTNGTFGWKAATRRTGVTTNQSYDGHVTTVNLRDFTTNTAVSTNQTLTQYEQTRTIDFSGMDKPALATAPPQQKSIVWITTEKMQPNSQEDDGFAK